MVAAQTHANLTPRSSIGCYVHTKKEVRNDSLFNDFSNIIALLAVIFSIISIIFARKNIKTIKFIETITNQRIIWIDNLRNDFSKILVHANTLMQFEYIRYMQRNYNGADDPVERDAYNSFLTQKKSEYEKCRLNSYEIVNLIELAILKLNDTDDIELIKQLEQLETIYYYQKYNDLTKEFIKDLRMHIKQILKSEWEKVKMETIRGRGVKFKN